MQRLELVRFLADSAAELLDPATLTDANQSARLDEASELMNLGAVTELPALNSFYQRPEEEESNMRALRKFLSEQAVDKTLIVLVTHQVTITALTGVYPASGTGVLMLLDGKGGFEMGPIVQFE